MPLQYTAEYPRFLQNDLPVDTAVGLSWTTRTPTPTHPPPPSEKEEKEDSTQKHLDRNFYLSYIKARADREGSVLSSPISNRRTKFDIGGIRLPAAQMRIELWWHVIGILCRFLKN